MITPVEYSLRAASISLNLAVMEEIRAHIDEAIRVHSQRVPAPEVIPVEVPRCGWRLAEVDAVLAEYGEAGWGVRRVPRLLVELFLRREG